jgi:catechol 2,3-dioxygenase-like lactoylglutathione lyase family enzyme
MTRPNGIHHLAICTADIKRQIEFFTDVMGMELVALYWMHGAEGAWHGFLRLNDRSAIAFVQTPEIGKIPAELGRTYAGNAGLPAAPGTMQHVAFNVDGEAELLAMRDRIRSRGVHVFGHLDHGMCKSIYFAGPENLTLEVSTDEGRPIDPAAWIDPEVVALAGISPEELARYKSPAPYARPAEPVPQPGAESAAPRMAYPAPVYDMMLRIPDAVLTAQASEPDPPVKPGH